MTEEQITNENDEAETNESGETTIKKHRSPNYPFMGLEAALERTNQLLKIAGVHSIRVTTAWETWDYKKGAGNQIVAALDAYGLITTESGLADNRQIKLTLEARKILDNHSERAELLKKAALLPDLHKDMWEHFKGDLPPDNRVIREYLVYQRNFNPDYVNKFIEQFRASLAFANVSNDDKLSVVNDSENNSDEIADSSFNDANRGNLMESRERTQRMATLPQGQIFKASIEVYADGKLDVVFAGSMNGTTVSLLKDIYDIKERYESKAIPAMQAKSETIKEMPLLENGQDSTEN